jgi:hypothetical protein
VNDDELVGESDLILVVCWSEAEVRLESSTVDDVLLLSRAAFGWS